MFWMTFGMSSGLRKMRMDSPISPSSVIPKLNITLSPLEYFGNPYGDEKEAD